MRKIAVPNFKKYQKKKNVDTQAVAKFWDYSDSSIPSGSFFGDIEFGGSKITRFPILETLQAAGENVKKFRITGLQASSNRVDIEALLVNPS